MIPDSALEAAAKAYLEQKVELGYAKWDDLPSYAQEWRMEHMRAALEAAAPYMLAACNQERKAV